ncbi:MAG: type 1 glutamine amidotransferase [Gaiellaceae bacterium]
MSLRIAVLQHEPETGLGVFSSLLDEAGVDHEVLETTAPTPLPDVAGFDGAIALGGSLGAHEVALLQARHWIRDAVRRDAPFLGICLGGQLLATALGGFVVHDVLLTEAGKHDSLFAGLPGRFPVLGWHEDAFVLPRRAIPLAGSIAYEHQAFRFGANAYGLQFNPEVRLDDLGGWATVPGYAGLLERAGADWGEVGSALEQAAPELDTLAEELLERWLYLVAGVAALRERRTRVAV